MDRPRGDRAPVPAAVAVAQQLPHGLGAELLGTAREAFTQAFQLTAAISAAVALITAVLATALLRRVRVGSRLEEQAESLP